MLGSLASLGSLVRMSGILHERGKSIPALCPVMASPPRLDCSEQTQASWPSEQKPGATSTEHTAAIAAQYLVE